MWTNECLRSGGGLKCHGWGMGLNLRTVLWNYKSSITFFLKIKTSKTYYSAQYPEVCQDLDVKIKKAIMIRKMKFHLHLLLCGIQWGLGQTLFALSSYQLYSVLVRKWIIHKMIFRSGIRPHNNHAFQLCLWAWMYLTKTF